ncbi:MAG: hypothetical protein LBC91_01950, partial [Candidatus Accumulibacter sp.]|nr:hypothetical protein [Accumulibacter sp.]
KNAIPCGTKRHRFRLPVADAAGGMFWGANKSGGKMPNKALALAKHRRFFSPRERPPPAGKPDAPS